MKTIINKATLVIDPKHYELFFYNWAGDRVAKKLITNEDFEGLEAYGVDFETLSESAILDLEHVLAEVGAMWDDLSSFTELAGKAMR